MARKVKCKICKKEMTTDTAYCVEGDYDKYGKVKRSYYCSKEEYEHKKKEQETKEECYKYAEELINLPYSALMRKKINELAKYYEYQVIYRCFKADRDKISFWANNKTFNNEHALVSYIIAIINGNINDINKQYKKEQEDFKKLFEEPKNDIDLDVLNNIDNIPKGKPKNANDISEWLDD